MDTVYLALDVFRQKTANELGTVQNYAPLYIVEYKISNSMYYTRLYIQVSNLEEAKQCHDQGGGCMGEG